MLRALVCAAALLPAAGCGACNERPDGEPSLAPTSTREPAPADAEVKRCRLTQDGEVALAVPIPGEIWRAHGFLMSDRQMGVDLDARGCVLSSVRGDPTGGRILVEIFSPQDVELGGPDALASWLEEIDYFAEPPTEGTAGRVQLLGEQVGYALLIGEPRGASPGERHVVATTTEHVGRTVVVTAIAMGADDIEEARLRISEIRPAP